MSEVIIVIGAGSIGQAIARRVSAGKHLVLADLNDANADAAAEVLRDAGFDVSTKTVDVSSRESVHALVETATRLGDVTGLIHAAGVSPSQAYPATILAVDLYGTETQLAPHVPDEPTPTRDPRATYTCPMHPEVRRESPGLLHAHLSTSGLTRLAGVPPSSTDSRPSTMSVVWLVSVS